MQANTPDPNRQTNRRMGLNDIIDAVELLAPLDKSRLVKAIVTEDPSLAIVSNSLTGSMLSQINLMSIEQAAEILETVAMQVEAEQRTDQN